MTSARRIGGSAAAVAAAAMLALALAACGVKSSPQHPEGAGYPRQYPATGESTPGPGEKAKEGQISPLGFPYEYPNRPPPR